MSETAPSSSSPLFSAADFERRARDRLDLSIPQELPHIDAAAGDHVLDRVLPPIRPLRPAAVLIALVPRRSETTIILTQRPEGMRHHAGQIALPGGKIEPGDASPAEAALREAEEELGLDRSHVEPIGYLDPYVTGTGFIIVPTVGIARPPFRLAPDPREVADAFEVPLAFLMDAANHQRHSRDMGSGHRTFYAMPFKGRFIWGATAGILRNLYERLWA